MLKAVARLAETVEHIVRGTMYGPTLRTPRLRSRSAASTCHWLEPPPEVADLGFVQPCIGDGVAQGDVAVGRRVAHETLELAVDLRVKVDVDAAANLATQAGFGVIGQGDDAGTAFAQGAGNGVQIVAEAGGDTHAGNDDATHQKLSVEVNRPTRKSLAL